MPAEAARDYLPAGELRGCHRSPTTQHLNRGHQVSKGHKSHGIRHWMRHSIPMGSDTICSCMPERCTPSYLRSLTLISCSCLSLISDSQLQVLFWRLSRPGERNPYHHQGHHGTRHSQEILVPDWLITSHVT